MNRRTALATLGTLSISGCLRLTGGGDQPSSTTDGGTTTGRTTTVQTPTNGSSGTSDVIDATRLELSIGNEATLEEVDVLADGNEIDGTFDGDKQLFSRRTFARYVVEIVEGGSVINHTAGRVYGVGYRWRLAQTNESVFITRQPGVRENWPVTFVIGDDWLDTQRPELTPDGQAFKIDPSAFDVDPGVYEWNLRIGKDPVYVNIRSAFGNVITVGETPGSRTRSEALDYVSAVVDESTGPLGTYDKSGPDGIQFIEGGGTQSGTLDNDAASTSSGMEIEGNISIGGGRTLRIRNLATETSARFIPD